MSAKITFHGHATFTIELPDTKILVDPFLKGNNPLAKTAAEDITDVDYILVTHGHADHLADAASIAKRCDATIIANFEIADWFGRQGVEKTHPQHLGGGFQHPFGYLKMTTAFHGSKLPDGEDGGMPGGFLLQTGEETIYIAGDTALFSDMSLIGEAGIDLAILPIGDNFTMGPDDALKAVNYLQPKMVVPCHFNTFGYIMQDGAAWVERVSAETDAKGILMDIDASITI